MSATEAQLGSGFEVEPECGAWESAVESLLVRLRVRSVLGPKRGPKWSPNEVRNGLQMRSEMVPGKGPKMTTYNN